MLFRNIGIFICLLSFIRVAGAEITVKIVHIKGDVKIRYGVEENWQHASIGMLLKEIDSIISGEKSEVILEFDSGKTFILGSNSMLDIGDLRKIYEKELFLYLMSRKVEQIEPRKEKTPLRIGNVSVVHGESKVAADSMKQDSSKLTWLEHELNGALALFFQEYYPNAIVKLSKILAKYGSYVDCGKTYFYMAKSFEILNMKGQAIDTYKIVVDTIKEYNCENDQTKKWLEESQKALERLRL